MAVTRETKTAARLLTLLLIVVLFISLLPSAARSEDYVTMQGYLHAFNNDVIVTSGVFALNKDFNLKTSVYFKYTVDFIKSDTLGTSSVSGASSAATGAGLDDTRNEVTIGGTQKLPYDFTVSAYYDYSQEDDYVSHTPTISIQKELFEKNLTLTFGYSRNIDEVSGKFAGMNMDRDTDNYFFGITQLLSPVSLVFAGYTYSKSNGFLPEGIRLVALGAQDPSLCTVETLTCVDEVFPNSRSRSAFSLGTHYYIKDGTLERSSIRVKYRYYTDDWDIHAHTLEGEFYKYLTDKDIIKLNYRYYQQDQSSFYMESYTGAEAFLSASPQHTKNESHLGGVKYIRKFDKLAGIDFIGSKAEVKYEYYSERSGVAAHIGMLGLRFVF